MIPLRSTPLALALLLAFAGTGCSEEARQTAADAKATVAEATAEGGVVDRALAEARETMRAGNLTLGTTDALPKAELTPQGDLLINGVALPLNDEQRAAVLAYREELLAIGDAGISMGREGISIAGDALALAAAGILGGDTRTGEAAIEAKGKAMEAAGQALCERAKGLAATQDALSVLVPEIAPYLKSIDIQADCKVAGDGNEAEPPVEAPAPPTDTLST
ncbi:MAG TPA: hypothetical protein DCM32_01245 [Xanthomonadaceae bacterium]|jgi:outer membrane PBP1 activator LpoA protein|nr:hypothetical protein [Xanthomonadaceae bacterium]